MITTLFRMSVAAGVLGAGAAAHAQGLPTVTVTKDDTVIDRSCRVVIPEGTVIADANGDGVIHIRTDGITVEFEGALLGAEPGTPWDTLTGIGVRVDGARGVTLKGARTHFYKIGILATGADGLVIDGADASDCYRQRLRSTPKAEDGSDWLYPHNNDRTKWRDQYGAAVCVEESEGVTIRNVVVRRGQNGIIIDRVNGSRIYDNDCSFLSGWGLAMWRSNGNTISRNAFDFCVRGHVEGVYNRGQDSAGILMFEQNSDNVVAENSATHGGDGIFGFAGLDAMGAAWLDEERARLRRAEKRDDVDGMIEVPPEVAARHERKGNNDNLFINNDLSYAPAHGFEMTFSFGNRFIGNRVVENAICGIWGGYSQDTLIAENLFAGNGGMAYGLERGGVNIEHGAGNVIVHNEFLNNKCAVHLWWDRDTGLLVGPWARANHRGVTGNVIAGNRFVIDDGHPFGNLRENDRIIVLQLRDDGGGNVAGNVYSGNEVIIEHPRGVEFAVERGTEPESTGPVAPYDRPDYVAYGESHPRGARRHLRGRDKIIMTEWGPWDHESPLVRLVDEGAETHRYEVHGVEPDRVRVEGESVRSEVTAAATEDAGWRLAVVAHGPGVHPYRVIVDDPAAGRERGGTIVNASWRVVVFPWTDGPDPREDADAWRALAEGPRALSATTGRLRLRYGGGGPSDVGLSDEITAAGLPRERFGTIARTTLPLTKGEWRIVTTSDDGVRVVVDGERVIENWTWHGPTRDEGRFTVEQDGTVEILVEHFEIDGYAVLELDIERVE